jgi:surfeit locus 1 family protein
VFLAIAGTLAVLFFVLFVALGTWQVERRAWKLDLIARVEQRVHAPPTAAPGPIEWPNVTAAADEYRHVATSGTFLDVSQTLVQAVTDLGAGYWVLTPLRLDDGSVVLVNRGFVQADDRDRVRPGAAVLPTSAAPGTMAGPQAMTSQPVTTGEATSAPPAPSVKVTGLLRMTEPRGGFLRHNDPVANRWYSRDVQAIAAARGLTRVAPYFIDAEAAPGDSAAGAPHAGGVAPVAGLTVITFHNSHLVYAITWYTLALMVAGAIWLGIRGETRT